MNYRLRPTCLVPSLLSFPGFFWGRGNLSLRSLDRSSSSAVDVVVTVVAVVVAVMLVSVSVSPVALLLF